MHNELVQWLEKNNLEIPNAAIDGKIHRFDRDGKKNAWFWGIQSFISKTGEPYILARVGDWKTDEQFEYTSNGAFSREEKKLIKAHLKEAQGKADRAKEALQMDAAEIAVSILGASRLERFTDYMNKKSIPNLYGARLCKQSTIDACEGRKPRGFGNDDILIIPMRDSNGKLWGLQKINHKGDKYFVTGQKKQGCFHSIPEDTDLLSADPIYICEGFATAASIHQATNCPVIVAFDAGNLVPVAQVIRSENTERPIIICGDDDIWGRRPDGSPYNAGREKAAEAAKAVMGKMIFPKFRDETGRPTDWNDLHVREGLPEVKKQLLEVKPERHYVHCLGHRDGNYFYTSSDNKELVAIRAHSPSDMLNLMPLEYWETLYPGKRGIDFFKASNDLMSRCRQNGIFWPENIRGVGVWDDAGRTVIHLGDRLHLDGQELGIHGMQSRFLYALGSSCRSVHRSPLTLDECRPIHELLGLINFERSEQKYFLGGWLMSARLSGLLSWRPQIWITGESGSGKSTLLQEFVLPMLGDQRKRFTGATTEAGMRQAIRADAVPVIFDEFETDTPEAIYRVKGCLDFIRQASTDSGHIVKGSSNGEAVQYKARFCAAVSAIRTLLNTQADRTRFTLVELKRLNKDCAQWAKVQKALKLFTPDYADRYFARLLTMLPAIQENQRRFESAFASRHSQRLGQQYGPLMAGWSAIVADGELSDAEIEDLVDSIDFNQETAASGETDQADCISHILARQITVSVKDHIRDDITVADALEAAKLNPLYNSELGRYGLRLVQSKEGFGFFISNRNPQLSQLFRDSSWASGWTLSLGRLPGARRNHAAYFGRHTVKGVLIPLTTVFPER